MNITMLSCIGFILCHVFCQWHLVCDTRSLNQMGQTVYMGGVLVGALLFGGLSDR